MIPDFEKMFQEVLQSSLKQAFDEQTPKKPHLLDAEAVEIAAKNIKMQFDSFVKVGFTEEQAMNLLMGSIAAASLKGGRKL